MGAVLCGLTIIATTWTLLAAGWVDGAGGAVVVAVGAVIEAAVLAYARVSRLLAVALIPVLSLAAIIPATIGSLPVDGDPSFWHLLARYVSASFGGLAATQDWPFTVGLCAVLWICGYWMTWVALREHRGVLAVLPVYIILATNVLNARSGHDVPLPTVLSLGLSLLVIANAHLDALQSRWAKRQIRSMPGIRSGMVGSAAIAAVAILLAGSLLPRATTQDISGDFFTTGSGSGGHATAGDAGSGGAPVTIAFNGVTQPGGPLVSNPRPVLTYTSSTIAPVYLRVINDTEFSQGNWYPEHGGASYDHNLAFSGVTFSAGALPRDSLVAGGATAAIATTLTLRPNATGDSDRAVFPGEPLSVTANGIAYGTVDASRNIDELLTVDSVDLGIGISNQGTVITTRAFVSTATQDELRNAGTTYPQYVQRYTALADDGTHGAARIASLARAWTQGAMNPYDQAAAIEQHLRDPAAFTYTLSPPAPPASEWPVVYFLFDSHRGYCQYFASAMGAMLRSLGIPTRLVNGYGPGTTLATGNRHGQRVQQVTTSDAHTWVEAYFPGYGWVPFEPTPPSAQGDYVPIPRGSAAVAPNTASADANQRPGSTNGVDPIVRPLPAPQPARHARGAAPDLRIAGLAVLGTLVSTLAGALLWLLLPRSERGAWRRLEVVGALLGIGRNAHETHHAYARRYDAYAREWALALADAVAASEFAPRGESVGGSRRARRLWLRVFRSAPGVAWRSITHRTAPA